MDATGSTAALVLAAGRGTRLARGVPKAFVELAGRTLLVRSLRALSEAGTFGHLQPVIGARDHVYLEGLGLDAIEKVNAPVEGGAERQDSVAAGLRALPDGVEWVAVHDAARCLVSPDDVRRVVAAGRTYGAAILAERVRDTIKCVEEGRIVETPPRETCWAALTPQVIRRDWLEEGLESAARAGRLATDDVQLVEWLGREVRVVESRSPNPKITRPEDLAMAEALLRAGTSGDGERR